MSKLVWLDPIWKLHVAYRQLLLQLPPNGYQFVHREGLLDRLSTAASKVSLMGSLLGQVYKIAPMTLLKSYVDSHTKRPPLEAVLTYACGHVVFRKERWVTELANVLDPVGREPAHFRRFKHIVEKRLSSPDCRAVLCWSEFAKATILANLDCSGFKEKLKVIPRAVPPAAQMPMPHRSDGAVRLFFLGSANMAGEFKGRGGGEVLEAFNILHGRYPNLELTVRSDVPADMRNQLTGRAGIRLIDHVIPRRDLEGQLSRSDILLFPGYYCAWVAILEGMSFGLPVVATDVHNTREYVLDGETGFLIKASLRVPSRDVDVEKLAVNPAIGYRDPDRNVVEEIVRKLTLLIENAELRRRMGHNARRLVNEGPFSIKHRNDLLVSVLDDAVTSKVG
jgi:glycosyltransferase involved in cell wall biosynthesis